MLGKACDHGIPRNLIFLRHFIKLPLSVINATTLCIQCD
uniref:Uncharacterized protein n=1 Tax=Rhizophora mucronata TaxID=61149 RepID=A0A2P2QAV2_RHIMU